MGNMCNTASVAVKPAQPPDTKPPTPSPSPSPRATTPLPHRVRSSNIACKIHHFTYPDNVYNVHCVIKEGAVAGSLDDDHSLIRLLLLGAAESGKTTLLEQIRLLYQHDYTEGEMFHRKTFIYSNILESIQKLSKYVMEQNGGLSSYENSGYAQNLILEDMHNSRFTPEQEKAISHVWADPLIQDAYKKRSKFNLNDSTKYFLDNLSTMNGVDYRPTPMDVIMSYVPTVGVQNVVFTASNKTFQDELRLFDIGGQRIDRRKWATMYDGIDAIFFCLAISEYDQLMMEDMKTTIINESLWVVKDRSNQLVHKLANRLEDALSLLEQISVEPKFTSTPIFLFLNEIDVFTQKLSVFPLENYLPDYQGKSNDDALHFMENLARSKVNREDKHLLIVYKTVMIDTKQTSKVLSEVFKKHLKAHHP